MPMNLKIWTLLAGIFFGISFESLYAQDDLSLDDPILGLEPAADSGSGGSGNSGGDKDAPPQSKSLLDLIKLGGWAMWVLIPMFFVVVVLVIYLSIDFSRKNFVPPELVPPLQADLEQADLELAGAKLQPAQNCLSATLRAGFDYIAEKGFDVLESERMADLMSAANRRFNRQRVQLVGYLSLIAAGAPMMGLLGTVSGMIGAFGTLENSGGGNPSAFAGDISEALVTTASGLIVALPAIFAFGFLRNKLQSQVAQTDDAAEALMTRLRLALAAYDSDEEDAEE